MTLHRPLRSCLALVVAYAVALQILLAPFAAPQARGAAGFEICRSERADVPAQSPAHEGCLACLSGHCAAALGGVDRSAVAVPWPPIADAGVAATAPLAPPAIAAGGQPHAPRAPPLG